MEDVKLILVDIDGTLLNDDGIITPKTKEAIARIKEKNIMFGIATGRTPYAVKHLIKDWQIDKYVDLIMGFNGGCYLDLKNNRTKSHYLLDGKLIPEILNEFNRFNFNVGIYDKESLHVLEDEKIAKAIAKRNKLPLIIDDLRQYYNRQIEKILFMADTEELDKIDQYYQTLVDLDYRLVRSTPIIIEYLNPQLSKSLGIRKMCEDIKIDTANIIVFGDELNDYEMIRDYIGVAMENANPAIKEIANYITKSNNEDGIADFLIKYKII